MFIERERKNLYVLITNDSNIINIDEPVSSMKIIYIHMILFYLHYETNKLHICRNGSGYFYSTWHMQIPKLFLVFKSSSDFYERRLLYLV